MSTAQQLLLEGGSDAIGFVGGALLGWGLSHVLGLDLFAQGYGAGSIAAIAMVGGRGCVSHSALRCRLLRPVPDLYRDHSRHRVVDITAYRRSARRIGLDPDHLRV